MISLFAQHVAKWSACTGCTLHETRRSVVISRGHVPCDIVFIGEAPGESEDVLGRPFCGPAGKLLDSIIEQAMTVTTKPLRWAFTNVVCCIPREDGRKASAPMSGEITACSGRLKEFVRIAAPRLIVCVGALARDWVPQFIDPTEEGLEMSEVMHPAAILRANVAQRDLLIRRAVVALANAIKELQ